MEKAATTLSHSTSFTLASKAKDYFILIKCLELVSETLWLVMYNFNNTLIKLWLVMISIEVEL